MSLGSSRVPAMHQRADNRARRHAQHRDARPEPLNDERPEDGARRRPDSSTHLQRAGWPPAGVKPTSAQSTSPARR